MCYCCARRKICKIQKYPNKSRFLRRQNRRHLSVNQTVSWPPRLPVNPGDCSHVHSEIPATGRQESLMRRQSHSRPWEINGFTRFIKRCSDHSEWRFFIYTNYFEATVGIEPTHSSFADCRLTTCLRGHKIRPIPRSSSNVWRWLDSIYF